MGLVNGIGNLGGVYAFSFQDGSPENADWTTSGLDHTYGKPSGVRSTTSRWPSRSVLYCSQVFWVSVS